MEEDIPLDLRMHRAMSDNIGVDPTLAPAEQYFTSNISTPAKVICMRPPTVNGRNRSKIRYNIYTESSPVYDSFTPQDLQGQPIYYTDPTVTRNRTFMQHSHSFLLRSHPSRMQRQ